MLSLARTIFSCTCMNSCTVLRHYKKVKWYIHFEKLEKFSWKWSVIAAAYISHRRHEKLWPWWKSTPGLSLCYPVPISPKIFACNSNLMDNLYHYHSNFWILNFLNLNLKKIWIWIFWIWKKYCPSDLWNSALVQNLQRLLHLNFNESKMKFPSNLNCDGNIISETDPRPCAANSFKSLRPILKAHVVMELGQDWFR